LLKGHVGYLLWLVVQDTGYLAYVFVVVNNVSIVVAIVSLKHQVRLKTFTIVLAEIGIYMQEWVWEFDGLVVNDSDVKDNVWS